MNNLASLFSSMTKRLVRFNSLILQFDEVRFFLLSFFKLRFLKFFGRIFRCFERIGEEVFLVWCVYILDKKKKKFRWNNNLGESNFSFFLIVDRFRSIAIKGFSILGESRFAVFLQKFLRILENTKYFDH